MPHADNTTELLSRSGKVDSIFLCYVCQLIFDTRKELSQHAKTHLTCKFCKKRVKNVADLHDHMQTTCLIALAVNPPDLRLTRVDKIPSIVEKYPEVFQDFKAKAIETSKERDENSIFTTELKAEPIGTIDTDILIISDEDDEGASSAPEPDSVAFESQISDHGDNTNLPESDTHVQETPVEIRIDEANEQEIPAVNEPQQMESVSVVRPKINTVSAQSVPNLHYRNNVIQLLFSKYAKSYKFANRSTDPYVPSHADISEENNVTMFKGLFRDLSYSKIPIYFKRHEKISASFVPKRTENKVSQKIMWPSAVAVKIMNPKYLKTSASKVQVSSNLLLMTPTNSVIKRTRNTPPLQTGGRIPLHIMPKTTNASSSPRTHQGANCKWPTLSSYFENSAKSDEKSVNHTKGTTRTINSQSLLPSASNAHLNVVNVLSNSNSQLFNSSQPITTNAMLNTNNIYSSTNLFNSTSMTIPNNIYSTNQVVSSGQVTVPNQIFNPIIATFPLLGTSPSFVTNQSIGIPSDTVRTTGRTLNRSFNQSSTTNIFNDISNSVFGGHQTVLNGIFNSVNSGQMLNLKQLVDQNCFASRPSSSSGTLPTSERDPLAVSDTAVNTVSEKNSSAGAGIVWVKDISKLTNVSQNR